MIRTFFQRGMSMIELLVAMAIGAFLIIGAVTLQSQTRTTFTVNEQQARLQETARYVFSVMGPEIELAGLYGYSNNPSVIRVKLSTGSTKYVGDMRQNEAAETNLPGALSTSCGDNFALDLTQTTEAENNTYTLDCAAQGGGHNGVSDTLILRRASMTESTATSARLQLLTSRRVPMDQRLFVSNAPPSTPESGVKEVRDIMVQAYYVARNSDTRPGVPALRVKQLAAGPSWEDQEVVRGVEDIQVEFGVDPGEDRDGNLIPDDVGNDGMADFVNGDAQVFVAPDAAVVRSGQVVAVRVWVRVRAEQEEQGFVDNRTYNYASVVNFRPADKYRRVLMSRTFYLRNTRAFPN